MGDKYLALFSSSLESLKDQMDNVFNVLNTAPPGMVDKKYGKPGYVLPYDLPDEDSPKVFLTPTTIYSINEAGKVGPLEEYQIIELLSRKFDRRLRRTIDIINRYSEDVDGVKCQLQNLRNRIVEIEAVEHIRSEAVHKIIRKMLSAIRQFEELQTTADEIGSGDLSDYEQPNPQRVEGILTPASKLALLESGQKGPLNEQNLKLLFSDRLHSGWKHNLLIILQHTKDVEGLRKQLEGVRDRIDGVEHLQRYRNNFIIGQITKALADIEEEIY